MATQLPYDQNCCACRGSCMHTGPCSLCDRHMPNRWTTDNATSALLTRDELLNEIVKLRKEKADLQEQLKKTWQVK